MDRLIVKNFGPLKDIDIELNRINLFIGENGSGKSVLAKLVTIFTDKNNWEDNKILTEIEEFNIPFITDKTFIKFSINNNEQRSIILKNKKIEYGDLFKELNYVLEQTKLNKEMVDTLTNQVKNIPIEIKKLIEFEMINYLKINKRLSSQYIPAERSFISIISKSLSSLIVSDIPLPKFFLRFSSEFEKARNSIKELNFLNIKYIYTDKIEIYYSDNEYLELEKSSSGIQSALPLYLTVKYFTQNYRNIIIEEPEQNLFPKAQKETVEYIIEQLGEENSLFMMTHSPYILTALNNLILANDVKNQKGIEAIKGLVKEEQCVAFEDVSAYSLIDGKAIDIMDREDRIIGVNVIDSISDEVNNIFDELLAKLD